jgi:hypothetical protein
MSSRSHACDRPAVGLPTTLRVAARTAGVALIAVTMAGCGNDGSGGDGSGGEGAIGVTTTGNGGASSDAGRGGEASSASSAASGGSSGEGGGACLGSTSPCDGDAACCAGLTCGTTTLGQVCCGESGAPCATANGEDCCGDLLCVAGTCLGSGVAPVFQAPFPCGQSWTYSHHSQEVRRALDFVDEAGNTNGAPALAAAQGIATQHHEPGGAGDYIALEHGGGWKTYYFHLQAFSVGDGEMVGQGQEVGKVGSTGASSGPHLHFEQLLNGEGKDIVIDGAPLAPYPGSYFQQSSTSNNCPDEP